MNTAIVVPSGPGRNLKEFVEAWGKLQKHDLYIIQDMYKATWPDAYDWRAIDKSEIGKLISRGDSAIRSFGFWLAKEHDLVITLDDDCFPLDWGDESHGMATSFITQHRLAMEMERWRSTMPGITARGMPYEREHRRPGLGRVLLNIGLWTGDPDVNAVERVGRTIRTISLDDILCNGQTVPSGQYVPMCGMNLAMRREILPLMYFAPMGNGRPYGRFDDIWCGIIAKRICDHLGWLWTFGPPYVQHKQASDPFRSLIKEAPGIAEHEFFWKYVDDMIFPDKADAVGCMQIAGQRVKEYKPHYPKIAGDYFKLYGYNMIQWADLFDEPG